ncbi:hypothetical protein G3569_11430 [Aliifodinibius halophilus]|uniref:Uncharacterized protein n=2 Tax=Fodinibius halophilus TaxID=1736908 RepID=A0A6M1TK88_9BACT|nr:hypothetical protein [Fodinibius halophilus]
MHLHKCFFTLLLILFAGQQSFAQQNSDFTLHADPQNPTAQLIKERIIEIQHGINNPGSWKDFTLTGKHPATGLLNSLADKHNIQSLRVPDNVQLLNRKDGSYEVRELFVKTAPANAFSHKELILHFNWRGQLIGTKLGDPIHNYQLALDRNIWTTPDQSRIIKNYIRRYQTALTNGNSAAIDSLLAADALIIKGNIARYRHDEQQGPYFQYRRVSKQRYIDIINQSAKKPKIHFEQFRSYQHPKVKDVYVITFKQSWETPSYSDKGYAVIVLDFRGKNPKVGMKSWQSYAYEVGNLENNTPYINNLAAAPLSTPYQPSDKLNNLQPYTHKDNSPEKGFFKKNRKFLLISAGASAAISLGTVLLTGGGESELPDPPGRPTMQ